MPQPHLKGLEPDMYLLLALVLLPLIEIALFILVGGWIGVWPTLGLIVLSALAGMAVVRRQGQGALNDMRRRLETLGDPSAPMAHGAMIMMAGFLLMLPGFFTDAMGILLLIPPVRRFILREASRRIQVRTFGMRTAGDARRPNEQNPKDIVIDAEFEEIPPGKNPTHGNSGWTRH